MKLNEEIYAKVSFSANVLEYPKTSTRTEKLGFLYNDNLTQKIKYINKKQFTEKIKIYLEKLRNLDDIEEYNYVGWTLKRTNMKMYPIEEELKYNIDDDIDRNQYSSVDTFEPIIVLHFSLTGEWSYIQTFFTRGWVKTEDIKIADYDIFKNIFLKSKLTVIKDRYEIGQYSFGIGSKIPLVNEDDEYYYVLLPDLSTTKLKKETIYYQKQPQYSNDLIRKIIKPLIGNLYDWGGKNGFRDCSSFTMDIFRVFDINLPRNSSQQSLIGKTLLQKPFNESDFLKTLKNATPYCTLLFMNGHVMMYGGKVGEDFSIIHAVKSLNNIEINSLTEQLILKEKLELHKKVIKINSICD
ncbi:MAG: SH3 domain-containing protein [Calditerrivibrio sp.]|nr:SH3 domain-containing protein [Calditerrivibrio sp.]